LEQLAKPGGVVIQSAARETIPNRFPFEYTDLGGHDVKGFDKPVQAYSVGIKRDSGIPSPDQADNRVRNTIVALVSVAVVAAGVALMWLKPWEEREEPASVERMAFLLPNKPSIVVLPFDVLSDEAEQDYLGDGLTNDIITALSKFTNLFVIASHSSFAYKNKPVKVQTVSEELGIRYVLKGSVQKTVDKVRINTQLIDALSGRHLWAERYDRQTTGLLTIQDSIVESVVANLAIQVDAAERERAKGKNTDSLEAYDYYLRADDIRFDWGEATNERARQLLEKAIELDPGYARAYAALAWAHVNDWRWGWVEDSELSKKLALEKARKAVELNPFDPESYHALGVVHLFSREFDKAIPLYEKAIALNPNDARLLVGTSPAWIYVGRIREAIRQIERALRLNPHHSDNDLNFLGWAYYEAKEYDRALSVLKKIEKSVWRTVLIATYVRLGRMEEAQAEVETLLKNDPEYSIERGKAFPWKDEEQWKHYFGALAEAGVPEYPPLKLPDKPSIAVLPFTNMSNDAEQEYFVDGMTEDLITDLSKLSELFVIARNSTFRYKGKSITVNQVARELGVRYVLEGSVRRAGNQVRINAQLIDATSEGHLWAERYDGALSDVFSLQDKVVRKIVTALEVELSTTQSNQLSEPQTNNAEAYDSLLKGWTYYRRNTPEDLARAVTHIEKAIELDPKYSRAYAALAAVYQSVFNKNWFSGTSTWNHKLGISTDVVIHREQENLDLAMENPDQLAYRVLSHRLSWKGEHEQAISSARTAIKLNPNDPVGHEALAIALIYAGEPQKAIELIEQAIRLDPHYPSEYIFWLGLAQFGLQNFNSAVATFIRATQSNPDNEVAHLLLAASYGHLGETDIALDKVKEANNLRNERQNGLIEAGLEPGVDFLLSGPFTLGDVNLWPFKLTEDRERLRQGLRLAGVPEESESKVSPLIIAGAKTIDAMEAKKLHDQGKRFIDVRGIDSWKNGHIPGAVNIPLKDTFSEVTLARVVSKQEPFVVYCMGPRCLLSSKACQQSVEWGYEQVHYFRAGFPSWKASGYPVEVQ
jgi:TolB-like protein/cytochrome c-type biogenesis protein CcmH/NrfG/rhodanese-related sulfurtransferase